MDPSDEVVLEIPYVLRIYKDDRVEHFFCPSDVPASFDPVTRVSSKDVVIDPATGVAARLYKPDIVEIELEKKLPLLIYFHGGGFSMEKASSLLYHDNLNFISSQANVIIVSVDYRIPPEHPLPVAYDDALTALQWVFSSNQDEWLRKLADFERVFIAGDSAGGNIAHNVLMRSKIKVKGLALVHPYFWGNTRLESEITKSGSQLLNAKVVDEMWPAIFPGASGNDDPRINPIAEAAPTLEGLACEKVLVCVAEMDLLKDRGRAYYEKLISSGWKGKVELMESKGQAHVFHLFNPICEKALEMMKVLVDFFNQECEMLREDAD